MIKSLILRTATRALTPLLLLVSLWLLLRGHHYPGGGFVGGLIAATAFALIAIAYNTAEARQRLRIAPNTLVGGGLLLVLASGSLGLLIGRPFLSGLWLEWELPLLGKLALGTPMLFDLGVYGIVLGVVMAMLLNLAEE